MLDTHCHVDLFEQPMDVANAAEAARVTTVAVTYLPTHYQLAVQNLRLFRYVRPALGFHPLVAKNDLKEMPLFRTLSGSADFIGEIGLDFSRAGRSSRIQQEECFAQILASLGTDHHFVTLHSRGAEDAVLSHIAAFGITRAVFHWFSGTRSKLVKLLDAGHSISINNAMIRATKWSDFIKVVPKSRVLTESDGPFAKVGRRPAQPTDMSVILLWLAERWKDSIEEAEQQIDDNFEACRSGRF